MSQPAVNLTEQDGALGILPPSSGKLLAIVGYSTAGTLNAPATYARSKDVIAAFGAGPLVEAACRYIERYAKPVLLVRTGSTVAGSVGSVTSVATGTSVVAVQASPTPNDDHEYKLLIVTGGTRGTAGITYKLSLDGGRTYGPETALGTAVTITIPGAGGVVLTIAAGTMVAGDYHTARSVAPQWNSTELGTALDALGASVATWGAAWIVGTLDATAFDVADAKIAGFNAVGKPHYWVGSPRMPTIGESEATYLAAINTIFSAKTTTYGALGFGAAKVSSAVSGRSYKRHAAFAWMPLQANVSEEENIADVNIGALPGVDIRDSNGNVDEHDESVNPGGDDGRFVTLRSWDGVQGVYVNRPRLFSADGSDFALIPHRAVMNLAEYAVRLYLIRRLNRPILVSKTTGFILESEALEIELGARAAMANELLAKPKASDVQFVLNRTDNVLSTKTLNGEARIVPLGYPEFIAVTIGFINPALQVQTV
jgi:hypothetical protein